MAKKSILAAIWALLLSVVVPIQANAVTTGVGDVTSAMIYETTSGVTPSAADTSDGDKIIGSILTDIKDSDDSSTYLDTPGAGGNDLGPSFKMNFFGASYDSLCVTTNGAVVPTNYENKNCTNAYDQPMADLAAAAEGPFIAAFSNDGNPGEQVQEEKVVTVESATFTSGVLVLQLAAGHGLVNGNNYCVFVFDPAMDNGADLADDPIDEVYGCSNATVATNEVTFDPTWKTSGNSTVDDFTFSPTSALKVVIYDNTDISETSDGWGTVAEIYAGNTVIDGRDAFVVTYYRVAQYDDANAAVFSNTYQIVLLKSTTGSDEAGWDFDIMYNYGTVQDGDDGYGSGCGSFEAACRTGVGIVDYDAPTARSNVYELFPDTPSRDLIDWRGTSALTKNSLNSDVLGRYTFQFVGGEPTDFAVPVMDGSGDTVARPEPVDPLAANETATTGLGEGQSSCVEVLASTECSGVTVAPTNEDDGVSFTASSWALTLTATDGSGSAAPLNSNGVLELSQSRFADISGSGFRANSIVKVYLFSTPTALGETTTDSNGDFSGSFPVPTGVPAGNHTVQVNGIQGSTARSLNLGVLVTSGAAPAYLGPILQTISPAAGPAGGIRSISGHTLATVKSATINGLDAPIQALTDTGFNLRVPCGLASGTYDLVVTSSFGNLKVQDAVVVEGSVCAGEGFKAWTKRMSDSEVKIYAKNVAAAGKIQFFVNGQEVAWVRAADATDPKLRVISDGPMAGANYLVRTVTLNEGKNRFEIKLDGVRVWRATYVPKG